MASYHNRSYSPSDEAISRVMSPPGLAKLVSLDQMGFCLHAKWTADACLGLASNPHRALVSVNFTGSDVVRHTVMGSGPSRPPPGTAPVRRGLVATRQQ